MTNFILRGDGGSLPLTTPIPHCPLPKTLRQYLTDLDNYSVPYIR